MIITSLKNPSVKLARSLHRRKYRKLHSRFLVEGIRLLKETLDNNAEIETIFHCPEKLRSEVGFKLLEEAQRRGVKILRVSERVIESISLKDNPQGIIGVAKTFQSDLKDVPLSPQSCILWAHEIRDPGNIGAMIRTCDAFGVGAFILTGNSADPFDPKSVRASMGSIFSVPIILRDDPMNVMEFLRASGFYLLATSPHAEKLSFELSYRFPLAVMVGNEGEGLPDRLMEMADERVRIPMTGSTDSLNVSVAAGVILYEAIRGRFR
jgi:TrmH family RNA methyltransferase